MARVAVFNVLVCVLVGPVIGVTALSVIAGVSVMPWSPDIAGVPLIVYALIGAAPFGVIAAIVSAALCIPLLKTAMAERGLGVWVLAGGMSGLLVGALFPLAVAALGWTYGGSISGGLAYGAVGGVAGAGCGILIGLHCAGVARTLRARR